MQSPRLLELLLIAIICINEGSCHSKIDDAKPKGSLSLNLASEETNDTTSTPPPPLILPPTTPPPEDEMVAIGRFLVTQVGTIMCYRSWEVDNKVNFHLCYVCFNDTFQPENELPKESHITQVETCFNQHISNTDYFKECLPKLRDSSLPNKPYDIFVEEPSFSYSYRNFARCVHGVTYKQEALKCTSAEDEVRGVDAFLDRFSCLMNNIVLDSRRFSEANHAELISSVPHLQQTNSSNLTISVKETNQE